MQEMKIILNTETHTLTVEIKLLIRCIIKSRNMKLYVVSLIKEK